MYYYSIFYLFIIKINTLFLGRKDYINIKVSPTRVIRSLLTLLFISSQFGH